MTSRLQYNTEYGSQNYDQLVIWRSESHILVSKNMFKNIRRVTYFQPGFPHWVGTDFDLLVFL